jgi:hypothetical protein
MNIDVIDLDLATAMIKDSFILYVRYIPGYVLSSLATHRSILLAGEID